MRVAQLQALQGTTMPHVYRSQQRIRGLKGSVRGGVTVVIESPAEVAALRALIQSAAALPGDALANAYHTIRGAGDQLGPWVDSVQLSNPIMADATENGRDEAAKDVGIDERAKELKIALNLAERMWVNQEEDVDQLALAMVLPKPGTRRLFLQTKRPTLMLDGGSVRARLTLAAVKLRKFGVALFPKARSRRQANLVEALRGRGDGHTLPRLEGVNPDDLADKRGIIVFLHGLMSTDAGTFDLLIKRIEQHAALEKVFALGWPHDTLAPIKVNAQDLADLIEDHLGPSGLPILFVCHSRGGLVARAAAVELLGANPRWVDRLKGAVTFGTPHEGAELAERADELLGKILLLKAVQKTGRFVPLVDALWAVHNRRNLEGITDLRPRRNGGEFLYKLRKSEGKQAKRVGGRVLPLFVIGGQAQPAGITGWLSRRFFGGEPNDLVVALSSTMPSSIRPSSATNTDHFSYFSDVEMKKPDLPALDFIVSTLGAPAIPSRPRTSSTKASSGASRQRRIPTRLQPAIKVTA
jgi:pimeloyl-ACP methyl ester carboxylesterase